MVVLMTIQVLGLIMEDHLVMKIVHWMMKKIYYLIQKMKKMIKNIKTYASNVVLIWVTVIQDNYVVNLIVEMLFNCINHHIFYKL